MAAVPGGVPASKLTGRILEPLELGDNLLYHAELLRQLLLGTHPLLAKVRVVECADVLQDLSDDAVGVDEPAMRG